MSQRIIPARRARHEIEVGNSRFIATAGPAFSVEEAREFVEDIRREFPEATHNVPAYIVGHDAKKTAHCNDDGEPPGTAGRPALSVLEGSGLGDVAVVVTRYFGGSKLGTGGLARAYSQAVREVLRRLPKARKVSTHTALLAVPYAGLQRVRRLCVQHGAEIRREDFAADVTLTLHVPVEGYEAWAGEIADLSAGRWPVEIIDTNPGTIVEMLSDAEGSGDEC